ncbi:unnamed protein product [Ectocarpus sp. 12 AP-2014]
MIQTCWTNDPDLLDKGLLRDMYKPFCSGGNSGSENTKQVGSVRAKVRSTSSNLGGNGRVNFCPHHPKVQQYFDVEFHSESRGAEAGAAGVVVESACDTHTTSEAAH